MRFSDVKIKSPCTENLEEPSAGCSGYFCKSCNNTVHDFRDLSEVQFNRQLQLLGPERCGIFYDDQLNPELYQNSATPRLLGFALTILTLMGLSTTESNAQSGPKDEVENIVRDRQSHGLIPRYGLAIENKKTPEKKGTLKVTKKPVCEAEEEEPIVRPKPNRRRILGIFPRKPRGRTRGMF